MATKYLKMVFNEYGNFLMSLKFDYEEQGFLYAVPHLGLMNSEDAAIG